MRLFFTIRSPHSSCSTGKKKKKLTKHSVASRFCSTYLHTKFFGEFKDGQFDNYNRPAPVSPHTESLGFPEEFTMHDINALVSLWLSCKNSLIYFVNVRWAGDCLLSVVAQQRVLKGLCRAACPSACASCRQPADRASGPHLALLTCWGCCSGPARQGKQGTNRPGPQPSSLRPHTGRTEGYN